MRWKRTWRNNGWKFPKFGKKHEPTVSRTWTNPKQDKPKEIHGDQKEVKQYCASIESTVKPESYIQQKEPSGIKRKWKHSWIKESLTEFVTRRPMLKMTKGSSLNRKATVKKGNLKHQKKQSRVSKVWVNKIGFSLEFLNYVWWLKLNIIALTWFKIHVEENVKITF